MAAGQTPTIAVVNSSEELLRLFALLLRVEGLSAVPIAVCRSVGAEPLIAMLAAQRPDVILFDIPAPYADWWQRYTQVRAAGSLRDRPCVVTSTNAPLVRQLAATAGGVEIVELPCRIEELTSAVRRALERPAESSAVRC